MPRTLGSPRIAVVLQSLPISEGGGCLPMNRTVVLAALTGALLVAVLIGGFIALDKTTLHWYAESAKAAPTATPVPVAPPVTAGFTSADAIRLTQNAVSSRSLAFPQGTNWMRCLTAEFRSANRKWVVTCGFYANKDDATAAVVKTYLFDDQSGQVDLGPGR